MNSPSGAFSHLDRGAAIFVFGHVGGGDAYGAVDQAVVVDSFRLKKK